MNARTFLRRSALCLAVLALGRPAAAATVTVAWDANPGAYISGYIVSYGTQSGDYTVHVDVGNQTSQQLSGLTDGVTYYFVVQSYDAARLVSIPSQEVAGRAGAGAIGAPTISCPSPTATSYSGAPVPVNFSALVAGGTAPVTTTCVPASGSLFQVGTTPLNCSATDAASLTGSCSSVVIVTGVSSASPLSISCPSIAPITAHNNNGIRVSYDDPIVSGGTAPVSTVCSPSSGTQFPIGTTPVTCTASDAARVTASCSTSVTVISPNGTSPAPDPGLGSYVEFDAVVSGLSGKCPSLTFSANGQTVVVSSATNFDKGSCSSMGNGKSVHVAGMQSNEQTVATRIVFNK